MVFTQKMKIINYIQKYGSVTSEEAYRDLSITQLGTQIKELKEEGYEFKIQWESKKNREGKIVRIKRYHLVKEFY